VPEETQEAYLSECISEEREMRLFYERLCNEKDKFISRLVARAARWKRAAKVERAGAKRWRKLYSATCARETKLAEQVKHMEQDLTAWMEVADVFAKRALPAEKRVEALEAALRDLVTEAFVNVGIKGRSLNSEIKLSFVNDNFAINQHVAAVKAQAILQREDHRAHTPSDPRA